jgi:hypothetical protein
MVVFFICSFPAGHPISHRLGMQDEEGDYLGPLCPDLCRVPCVTAVQACGNHPTITMLSCFVLFAVVAVILGLSEQQSPRLRLLCRTPAQVGVSLFPSAPAANYFFPSGIVFVGVACVLILCLYCRLLHRMGCC